MKVRELIEELEGCDEDAEVRIVFPQRSPLEYRVGRVSEYMLNGGNVAYVGMGGQIGYLAGEARDEFGR